MVLYDINCKQKNPPIWQLRTIDQTTSRQRFTHSIAQSINSFTKFPGLEAGAQLIIKDQLTVSTGGLYLDGLYGNVRAGWLAK